MQEFQEPNNKVPERKKRENGESIIKGLIQKFFLELKNMNFQVEKDQKCLTKQTKHLNQDANVKFKNNRKKEKVLQTSKEIKEIK